MLKSILVGAFLTIATVVIHALGTTWWIRRLQQRRESTLQVNRLFVQLRILCSTAVVLLLFHILEVHIWACVYMMLPDLAELDDIEEAIYFSTVTFASLGYGDVVISGSWRLLSAIQAMTGLLIFGWSTALLFAVVQRLWSDMEPSQRSNSRSADS